MASANIPTTLPQNQAPRIAALRLAAQLAALLLLGLAAVKVVTSVLLICATTLVALLGVIEGVLTGFLGLILIKITIDLRYAREAPQLAGTHFLNALDSWRDVCKTLIGVAVLAFLAAWARTA
jgi:hypothetical protein